MSKSNDNYNVPSAPIEVEVEEIHHIVQQQAQTTPYPDMPPPTYGATSSAFQQPPPAYQEAIHYPAMDQMPMPKPFSPNYQTPQPMAAPPPPPGPQPQIIRTTIITAGPGNCIWCRQGVVRNETDLCCLVCLIILAICTFPFGLVLLCCIPCTVRPRCSHCRRLQD